MSDKVVKMSDLDFLMGIKSEIKEVEVNGRIFHVKVMSAGERTMYQASLYDVEMVNGKPKMTLNLQNNNLMMVLLTVCDSKGKRLFKDNDIEVVKRMDNIAFEILLDAAEEINDRFEVAEKN